MVWNPADFASDLFSAFVYFFFSFKYKIKRHTVHNKKESQREFIACNMQFTSLILSAYAHKYKMYTYIPS